ncbi:MAG: hypothetical protein AB1758_17680 [Candidatus Eremiobacterota bacterium]
MSCNRRRGKRRGTSLATTLAVVILVVLIGFTIAGVSFSHLNVSSRQSNNQVARNRAEAVIAQALDRVIQDQEASPPTQFQGRIDLPAFPGEPAGSGVLAFDQTEATNLKIPFSTNNLGNDNSVSGWSSRSVPGDGVHLIGVGSCNGVSKRVEAVVYIPRFPYAIAASGAVTSLGGLVVASLEDPSILNTTAFADIPKDQIKAGHIATNSSDSTRALNLDGPGILITGDARAVGGINLGTQAVVEGEVRMNTDPVGIPDLDIASYDTAAQSGVQEVSGLQDALVLEGWNRSTGNLDVTNGLTLNGGVIYVEGNLTVTGGITGRGAVFATGDVDIRDGGTFYSDNLTAVIAQGKLNIQANPADGAKFKGVLYSEGDSLTASGITLLGAVVANGQSPSGTQMSLDNVTLIQAPDVTDMDIDFGQSQAGGSSTGGGSTGPDSPPPPPPPPAAWQAPPFNPGPPIDPAGWQTAGIDTTTGNKMFYRLTPKMADGALQPSDFGPPPYSPPTLDTLIDRMTWTIEIATGPPFPLGSPPTSVYTTLTDTTISGGVNALKDAINNATPTPLDATVSAGPLGNNVQTLIQPYRTSVADPQLTAMADYSSQTGQPVTSWGGGGGPGPTPTPTPTPTPITGSFQFSLNDSTTVDLKDRLRVLYWRDL